jgi:hypothetical protein
VTTCAELSLDSPQAAATTPAKKTWQHAKLSPPGLDQYWRWTRRDGLLPF